MIGAILLALSWGLLRLERKPLSVLGLDRPRRRLVELTLGLFAAGAFVALQQLLTARVAGFAWQRNDDYTGARALAALRFNVNSVLYEELVFRGYLLYQAIRLLGVRRACLLSAAAFGVYHWFSYGVFGALVPMAWVFVLTGSAGLMFAAAFARTGSLALPIGLHLGWNLVNIVGFSNGPIGDQLLVREPAGVAGLGLAGSLALNLALPLAFVASVLWSLRRKPERTDWPG